MVFFEASELLTSPAEKSDQVQLLLWDLTGDAKIFKRSTETPVNGFGTQRAVNAYIF